MKSKLLKGTVATSLLLCAFAGASSSAFASTTITASSDTQQIAAKEIGGVITPQVAYDYSIPDFSLAKGETAFTSRSGYGFVIDDDLGKDNNDFDLTFNVVGATVLLDVAIVKYSDYSQNRASVIANPSAYAVGGVKRVTAAGSGKNLHWYDFDYGTYVVLWKNVSSATNPTISINSAKLKTDW